jgi:hypothetical protein
MIVKCRTFAHARKAAGYTKKAQSNVWGLIA